MGKKSFRRCPKVIIIKLINRHVIDSLLRKPGAFKHYIYKQSLFINLTFRQAYDVLCKEYPTRGVKYYLQLLHMAKMYGEESVKAAIILLKEDGELPLPEKIKELMNLPREIPIVNINEPNLSVYDSLVEGCA